MTPVGFEPTISAGERPKTSVLDRAATGTGKNAILKEIILDQRCLGRVQQSQHQATGHEMEPHLLYGQISAIFYACDFRRWVTPSSKDHNYSL